MSHDLLQTISLFLTFALGVLAVLRGRQLAKAKADADASVKAKHEAAASHLETAQQLVGLAAAFVQMLGKAGPGSSLPGQRPLLSQEDQEALKRHLSDLTSVPTTPPAQPGVTPVSSSETMPTPTSGQRPDLEGPALVPGSEAVR